MKVISFLKAPLKTEAFPLCVSEKSAAVEMSSILTSKRSKVKDSGSPGDPTCQPGVHVYLFWTKEAARFLSHTGGEVTAEKLCIRAAKAVGESAAEASRPISPCSVLLLGVLTSLFIPQG